MRDQNLTKRVGGDSCLKQTGILNSVDFQCFVLLGYYFRKTQHFKLLGSHVGLTVEREKKNYISNNFGIFKGSQEA